MKRLNFRVSDALGEELEEFVNDPPDCVRKHMPGAVTKAKIARAALEYYLVDVVSIDDIEDPRIRVILEHYQWLREQYQKIKALAPTIAGNPEYEKMVMDFIGICEVTRGAGQEKH